MNQQNVELLSSEELENVTGGAKEEGFTGVALGVLKGIVGPFITPVLNFIPEKTGYFNTDCPGESAGRATSSLGLTVAAGFGVYKGISSLCSESGDEKEKSEATQTA